MVKKYKFKGRVAYLQQGLTPKQRKGQPYGIYDTFGGMLKLVKGGFSTKKESQTYRKKLR
tara:strand:+ start:1440 stop:1619 length:180 start_codon:yes stop_codon:yes gene_type:complete